MKPTSLMAAALFAAAAAQAAGRLVVTASHDIAIARPSETITVPWSEVAKALPGALLQKIAVKDGAGHSLPYQVTNIAPHAKDPENKGVAYGELIFQHNFAAGEKSATFTVELTEEPSPVFPTMAFARHIPERLDDFAWENDKIAHRTYGQALAAAAPPGSGKEVLVTSGLDVWAKRVSYPIVDRWYNKGHDHYHKDEGEGMDMYQVGPSRGCGGTGVWDGKALHVGRNYQSWKILANGPIRAVFELTYDTWMANGTIVSEVKRFTVDAGHNLDRIESTFTVATGPKEITVAIGLNKNPADRGQEPVIELTPGPAAGSFTQWIVQKTNGALGTAVIVPAGFQGFAEDERNHLLLAKVVSGQPLRYFAGAGWSKAGEFTTQQAWNDYVAACAARARSPVRISLGQVGAPTRAEVLALMERVADWQLAHPRSNDKGEGKPDGWVNAAFYAGVMALARDSASQRFHDAMMRMGEINQWRPAARPYHADDHAVSQTYLDLWLQHHDARMLTPTKERFDWILANPKDDTLDFDEKKNPDRLDRWSWCDALFMSPPAWLRLWKSTGDRRYLDFAVEKWWVTSDYLYDKEEHLYFRDSTIFERREKNGRKIFWSRGNGWVMGGLVRMLQLLPADHPSRPRFEQQFREMAAKVVTCQQADGFWRSSLLDPGSYPMQETSGTGFYCYALAWGINHGLLDRARFEPVVLRAWAALVSCVKDDGKLTQVQPIGFTPVTFDPESTEPFGVGAFLLAGSEIHRLSL